MDADDLSISSEVPSGSFNLDGTCSDDTDFLIRQNIHLNDINDEKSSTTTDLLYQSTVLQYLEEEKDMVNSKVLPNDTLFSKHYSRYGIEADFGVITEDNNFPDKSKSIIDPMKDDSNNSIVDNFSQIVISSPNHKALRSSTNKFQDIDAERSASVSHPLVPQSEYSETETTGLLDNRTLASLTSSGSKVSSKQSGRDSTLFCKEDNKLIPREEKQKRPKEWSESNRGVSLLDEKVEQGQRILAELFSKAEHDQNKAYETRLQRVKQWTLSEHNPLPENKQTSWSETEESPISASKSYMYERQDGSYLHKGSPVSNLGVYSSSPDRKESLYSTSSKEQSPKALTRQFFLNKRSDPGGINKYLLDNSEKTTSSKSENSFSRLLQESTPKQVNGSKEQKNHMATRKLNAEEDQMRDIEDLLHKKEELSVQIKDANQTLQRLQSDVQSLDQLAEQHRKQTILARSELLSVEKLREEAQVALDKLNDEEADRIRLKEKLTKTLADNEELRNKLSRKSIEISENESYKTEVSFLKEKLSNLEGKLTKDQLTARETISCLNKKLEEEKSKLRETEIGKTMAIRNIREELQEFSEAEKNDIMERYRKEKLAELEVMETNFKTEVSKLNSQLKDRDFQIQTLKNELKEREIAGTRTSEKSHQLELDVVMKNEKIEQLSTCIDEIKLESTNEVSTMRKRESELKDRLKDLNLQCQTQKDRLIRLEGRLEEEKKSNQTLLKKKELEIESLQRALSQNEASSRAFGERMRKEAKEMVQLALTEERENNLQETTQLKYKLEQVTSEKDAMTQSHNQEILLKDQENKLLQNTVDKQRKEIEECKKQSFEVQEQKVIAINNTRAELKEEIAKMKERLREMEKNDKSTALEITDECMKISVLTGSPMKKSSWLISPEKASTGNASIEAVKILKQYLEDFKAHVMNIKRQLNGSREDSLDQEFYNNSENPTSLLKEKEETIWRLERQITEMETQFRQEKETHEKIQKEAYENVEREIKNLTKNDYDLSNSPNPNTKSRAFANGVAEGSPTTKLLRHLQGRVKQLRAQNQSLKYSDDESYSSEPDSNVNLPVQDQFSDQSLSAVENKVLYLEQALKKAEDYGYRNASLLNQKMNEMTKLQKMLTQASKENMKLERAHANLQQRLAELIAK